MIPLAVLATVLTGFLAGAESIVRIGVQPALSRLRGAEAIRARQALIARLKWLVPSIAIPGFLVSIAAAAVATASGAALPAALHWIGVGFFALFWVIAGAGTVPINIRIADWDPEAPPADADAVVRRWAAVDFARYLAAALAFIATVLALAAAGALRLP
jgi:hypothetical protein